MHTKNPVFSQLISEMLSTQRQGKWEELIISYKRKQWRPPSKKKKERKKKPKLEENGRNQEGKQE
jgi:hypothetical protein